MANPFDIAVILRLVDQLTGPLGQATAAIEHVDRVAGAAQGLRNMGQHAMMSGAMVSATGAGVATGFREMLDPAIAFESAMADVNKTLDLDPGKLTEMSDAIAAMSTRIPMAATKLAEITAAAGQAGIARDELLRFTEDAAKMGVAFDISAGQAGGAMTGLRTIFGLTQDQVVKLGDSINHLSNNMDAKAADMLNIANRAGSTAKLFGLSGEQLNALSATMLALKSPPEVAATGINALLLKMATADKQSKKFQDGLEAIGMSAGELKAAIQTDAQGALVSFLDKVKGADDVMGTLSDLFGAEYADDIAKLVGSLDTYKQALGLVADPAAYSGSMLKEYETRAKTTANAIELLGNQANVLGITLGNLVLPVLNDVLPYIQAMVEGVTAFAKANPELFRTAMILVALAGAAALVLGPVMMMFGALATGAGVALSALSVLLGPIGLLVAAVAGAAVLIHRNWDGIAAFFRGLWAGFLEGLEPLGPALDGLAAAVAPILKAGRDLLDWVQSMFVPVDGLADAAGDLGAAWGQALGTMAAGMADPWLVDAAALVATAWEALPAVFDSVGAGLNRLRAWAQQFASGWAAGFLEAFEVSRFTTLSETLGPLGTALGDVGRAVMDLFGGMTDATRGADGLGAMAGRLAGGALNTLADLIRMVATVVTGLAQALAGVLRGDFGTVVEGWKTSLGGVMTFFDDLSNRLTGMNLYDAGVAVLQGLANGLLAGLQAAVAAIGSVASRIVTEFKAILGINSPSTLFAQFGEWIMDGLANGLTAKVKSVIDTVSGVASSVAKQFKSLLGINSPSTVFAGFGLNLVEGLENGINDNGADAAAAAAKLSRSVATAAAAVAVALPVSVAAAAEGMPDLSLAAQAIPMPAVAPLAEQGDAMAGGGGGGAAAGVAPVTVNLSVTLDGGDPDVVRRLEEWVRGEGGRLIADAVRREDERQARTAFDARGRGR